MNTIIAMNIYASIMIIIIILLRLFFITKISKRTFKILWFLVVLRLIVPVFIPFRITIHHAIINYNLENAIIYPLKNAERLKTTYTLEHTSNASFFIIVWLLGVIISFSIFISAYIRALKKFKKSSKTYNSEFLHIIKSFKLSRKIDIKISNYTQTLLTYGIFRPTIICPSNIFEYKKNYITYAMMHELIHIKNFDVVYKIITIISVCIHWFNPLMWVMLNFSIRDIELSCDEELLIRFPNSKFNYASTLIEFEEKRNNVFIFNAIGKNAVKERIELIMKFKKMSISHLCISICIILIITVLFAFSIKVETNAELATNVTSDSYVAASYEGTNIKDGYQNIVSFENGLEISLPPTAGYGVLRDVPKEEYKSGENAVYALEECFKDYSDFTYPVDTKNDNVYYYGGFNIHSEKGKNVYAMLGGTVIFSEFAFPFGNAIIIDHGDGNVWIYGHCNDLCVNVGDKVESGDIIAHVGSTGEAIDNMLYVYKY